MEKSTPFTVDDRKKGLNEREGWKIREGRVG